MGGKIVYQRINYDSVASNLDSVNSRKTKPGVKIEDSAQKVRGTCLSITSICSAAYLTLIRITIDLLFQV